jgi:hypothetical protein
MKRRSTLRNFCVLLLASSLCLFLPNQFPFPLPKVILDATHLSFQQLLLSHVWVLCLFASPAACCETYSLAIEFP